MQVIDLLRTQARANRLANHRLHAAMAALDVADFQAPRISFFPSLASTLNHLLAVDVYYIDAVCGQADMVERYKTFEPAWTMTELAERQARSDERLFACCESLRPGDEDRIVVLDRGGHEDRNPLALTLAHLFMHQTHHRGQAHAMLSGTSMAPPQLDEFLLISDGDRHAADLAALGWTSAQLFPAMAPQGR